MRLHSFSTSYSVNVLFGILLSSGTEFGTCNPITNSNFNKNIREFASKDDDINNTKVTTLQKEDPKRHADVVPFRPVFFKEVPDNKLSSTSIGRGIVSREHPGYALHDYEEYPHVSYGYDYHIPEPDHHHGYEHHGFDHQFGHHEGHYVGHHKQYNHALAAKAILWPIAGIALLGAAAALVTNPILLQLGVATGKRKRRNTEEISGPELSAEITAWRPQVKRNDALKTAMNHSKSTKWHRNEKTNKRISSSSERRPHKIISKPQSHTENSNTYPINEESDELEFIPIPNKVKHDLILTSQ